jgi:uncharacterized protein (TIGR01777 family)
VRILLTGSSGLIGRHLDPLLRRAGHEVIHLLRRRPEHPQAAAVLIDPKNPDLFLLEGFDGVIHLAGASVARRWTRRRRRQILASRADFTKNLCRALAKTSRPPKHFLCASGINYYGYRAGGELTEESPAGEGFLAEVCRQWEGATAPLLGTTPPARIALMRFGPVLSAEGGALGKLLLPFKLGMGAVMGTGGQMMSWISLPDALAAILHVLHTPALAGAVNMVGPEPVSNTEFSRALARRLGRPLLLRMPTPVVKVAFGRMASETILASHRVVPAKLAGSGFGFRHARLEEALGELLASG